MRDHLKRALSRAAACLALAGVAAPAALHAAEPASGRATAAPAAAEVGRPLGAGSPKAAYAYFQLAVYYLPQPGQDPLAALRRRLAESPDAPRLVDELERTPKQPLLRARLRKTVQQDYKPPSLETLRYSGRGLSLEQAQALQSSTQALVLDFAQPQAQALPAMRRALELAEAVARETGGLLWDEETREVFTPDAWRKRRLESWRDGVPRVSAQMTIHAYRNSDSGGDGVRAVTLGMAKFGLPDLVINDLSWSSNRTAGNLINALCQLLVEGAELPRPGTFDLDLKAIRHEGARRDQLADPGPEASGRARLSLRGAAKEEGDANNRLVEIVFDTSPGPDVHARQHALFDQVYGSEPDKVSHIRHDEVLLAASRAARSKLPALRKAFERGLQPGEYLMLKAPFAIPGGGKEWMWVEVTAWRDEAIEGLLKNQPLHIPALKPGSIVKIQEAEVFDYIRRYADGREEGNRTSHIIKQMQQQKEN